MDTKIIVVRHAQSEGNLKNEFHGQYPSDITELGVRQAECTALLLKDVKIDVAYASDTPRAFHTADIIASRHGIKVTPDSGLREINAGKWERMNFEAIARDFPKEYTVWKEDLGRAVCPDGESVAELQKRVRLTVEKIVRENAGKTVLIGTHATPVRTMACIWRGVPVEEAANVPWVPNASVSMVIYDSETLSHRVESYGFADHLVKAGLLTRLPKNI